MTLVKKKIESLGKGKEVYGMIHADLHLLNYLFYYGDVKAIDFNDCGWGYYLYDIAVTLYWLKGNRRFPELRNAFLKGYRKVRALSGAHEAYLDTFMLVRGMYIARWMIHRVGHPGLRKKAPWFIANAVRDAKNYLEKGELQ